MPLLELCQITKSFGGLVAVRDVDLVLDKGEILGLIGPNGAGKTTLINLITGLYRPTSGTVRFAGKDLSQFRIHEITRLGMARTFQNIRLFGRMSVLENVMIGCHCRTKAGAWGAILRLPWVAEEEKEIAAMSLQLLDFVGLDVDPKMRASGLSYGQQRRLEIARALATKPSFLLLDEPAAGMNPQETKELVLLVKRIRDTGRTILLIEHDMKMVMGTTDRVVVLEYGLKIAEGTPAEIQGDDRVVKAYLGDEENAGA